MVDQKKEHQKSLAQLVYDLKTKKILCRVRDYPAITLDELNQYVEKQGPLYNPVFGEQPEFFIDEGFFTPYRMVVYGNAKVAAKITSLLDGWSRWSGHGGRVTTSQGAFILEQGTDERKVRMPDVAYTPRDVDRALTNEQNRTCRGDPYVPTFVVEIDKLADRNSQRKALDRKMRDEYIPHGVQLGWLIDPRPQHRIIYEYKLDEHGQVHCVHNHKWRDLDGGNVLPGFRLRSVKLEMVLNQDSGSSSEEEVDLPCPIPRCRTRLRTLGSLTAHVEDHRTERAIAKYVANES
ncbi:Zinc finger, C2H2 [Plasmopara halstedii]|uniref:Zinc finger, C2H2 n=1 Tax=Plasmopara halstedii TaxID=4781 RepID=A0A0P1ASC6_PLAHL|nr:Zinc finger, C2H2 [Plasmopara halstedii]CEG44242.1 Zinc finger, C2H2 [Plasmopara halstedii]|eukprot:XP_024580611.1 Zinc finger, C2H2 [Plasmopara halstedii]